MKISVDNIELLIVNGAECECGEHEAAELAGGPHYGGNQDWYGSPWRRGAGCGPTTVATITSYMQRANAAQDVEKTEFVEHMNDVWRFVTPTMFGLPKTSQVRRRVEKLIEARGCPQAVTELEVAEKHELRPSYAQVVEYVAESLRRNVPVAFLCLENGGQETLDNWHWTTLVALDSETGEAEIVDSGRRFAIDLRRWLADSTMGGGFVVMT